MKQQIIGKFLNYYKTDSTDISVDDQGRISIAGSAELKVYNDDLVVKFYQIGQDFNCSETGLTTLDGSPEIVGADFICYDNNLTSLIGGPTQVGENYNAASNSLTNLKGSPQKIHGAFTVADNKLTSLIGGPTFVERYICEKNPLHSLKGLPIFANSFFVTYSKNLPLLPILTIRNCNHIFVRDRKGNELHDLTSILRRYLRTGTRGMLSCALEMIKAGYGSNARL